jgi:uncharacterized membrane protein YqjE
VTEAHRPGLYSSVKGLLSTALTLLQTRAQLLVTELEEERQRLFALLLWGAIAVLALGAGLIFVAIFLTVLLWDSHRLLVLGIFSASFLGLGLLAIYLACKLGRSPSGLFSASMAELNRDRAALREPDQE